jgi:hypothetical protein
MGGMTRHPGLEAQVCLEFIRKFDRIWSIESIGDYPDYDAGKWKVTDGWCCFNEGWMLKRSDIHPSSSGHNNPD